MISIQNVTKKYGDKVAVAGLNLEIAKGELFAFLGPNGAGKTTTIKMICGLMRPTEGVVRVAGYDMGVDAIKAKRVMAYVPDQPYLYDKLSGREFMRFTGDLYEMPQKKQNEEMERLISLFTMGDWIDEMTESYSHGMKQRVVLSATLLHQPEVIVVDEPMVGLDPLTSRLVRDIFRSETERGTTIFMSTHVISIAEDLAKNIGIINHGKLIALGSMSELRSKFDQEDGLEDLFLRIVAEQSETVTV